MLSKGKINIILISGKAGSGKSTLAIYLAHNLLGSGISSFAGRLKEIASALGWNGKKDVKGRKLLQSLATVLRDYDEDVWAKIVRDDILSDIFPKDVVIIPDWRYENELRLFKNEPMFKVHTIRVIGRHAELDNNSFHISENSLFDSGEYDFIASNVDGKAELKDTSYMISMELLGVKDDSKGP